MPKWEERLTPLRTKPTSSVAVVRDDWYVACLSRDLKGKPLALSMLGMPLVVYRGRTGAPATLLDRCPHRNAPLSLGRVRGDALECGYHGWVFDRDGQCQSIPGTCAGDFEPSASHHVPSFATREHDGFVWVYATPDAPPVREPFRFPHQDDPRYATIRERIPLNGSLHAAAENALDVPHTAFLHRGLFRKEGARNEIEVVITRSADRVQAEYIGEPRPEGLLGRILAPGGGVLTHFDRFILPCVAQVDYRVGDDSHVIASVPLTPISDHETIMFAAVSYRLPIPAAEWLGRAIKPLAMRIVRQDAVMLRAQTENVRRFGGEQYASTELDVLGPHILRLLRRAERGRSDDDASEFSESVKTVRMRI